MSDAPLWPTDDPRVVLTGVARFDAPMGDVIMVELDSAPWKPCIHTSAQAAMDVKEGQRLVLRGPWWFPA